MAVYKRTYKTYDGGLTSALTRFLVIPRYHFEEMARSRFLVMFFLGSMIYPLLCMGLIYLQHNLGILQSLNIDTPKAAEIIAIDEKFFLTFLGWQSMLAFAFSSFIGPGLISPDLVNNALPLYLSRPATRAEYVLGKMTVLATLLSLMTWIPGTLVYLLQGGMEGGTWITDNLPILGALFAGSWIWILLLTVLAMALSAWVRLKPVAGALMFGVFFVAAGFGAAINGIMRTKWGNLINISHLIGAVWVSLFEQPMRRGAGAVFFRVARGEEIPVWACWVSLFAICSICLWLLGKKIRGAEAVR
jgi:ABC-2 type transport system permease protein